jgi:hypothetical protein
VAFTAKPSEKPCSNQKGTWTLDKMLLYAEFNQPKSTTWQAVSGQLSGKSGNDRPGLWQALTSVPQSECAQAQIQSECSPARGCCWGSPNSHHAFFSNPYMRMPVLHFTWTLEAAVAALVCVQHVKKLHLWHSSVLEMRTHSKDTEENERRQGDRSHPSFFIPSLIVLPLFIPSLWFSSCKTMYTNWLASSQALGTP